MPKVKRAFGIVPHAEFASAVKSFLPTPPPGTPEAASADMDIVTACSVAFPESCESDALPGVQTRGLAPARIIDAFDVQPPGKSVLLFEAANDAVIPAGEAEVLAEKLRQKSVEAKVVVLKGNHEALPGDSRNGNALGAEFELFLAHGL